MNVNGLVEVWKSRDEQFPFMLYYSGPLAFLIEYLKN